MTVSLMLFIWSSLEYVPSMAPEWPSILQVDCGKSMSGFVAAIVTEERRIEQSMSEINRLT
jgi:hypothetical protein